MIFNITVCSIGPDQPNAMSMVGRIMVERPRGLRSVGGTCALRIGSSQELESKEN